MAAEESRSGGGGAGKGLMGGLRSTVQKMRDSALHKAARASQALSMRKIETHRHAAGLDLTYITPRLIAMSGFFESLMSRGGGNVASEVAAFLAAAHAPLSRCRLFNVGNKAVEPGSIPVEVEQKYVGSGNLRSLRRLHRAVASIEAFLRADPQNIAIICCPTGLDATGTVTAGVMCRTELLPSAVDAVRVFTAKRVVGGVPVLMPAQQRYVSYLEALYRGTRPHSCELRLVKLHLLVTPALSQQKPGCRPFVVIKVGDAVFATTRTSEPPSFFTCDEYCELPLGFAVHGDITVEVWHYSTVIKAEHNKLICSVRFHTGFVTNEAVVFKRDELDAGSAKCPLGPEFGIRLDVEHGPTHDDRMTWLSSVKPWETAAADNSGKGAVLFASAEERADFYRDYALMRGGAPTTSWRAGHADLELSDDEDGGMDADGDQSDVAGSAQFSDGSWSDAAPPANNTETTASVQSEAPQPDLLDLGESDRGSTAVHSGGAPPTATSDDLLGDLLGGDEPTALHAQSTESAGAAAFSTSDDLLGDFGTESSSTANPAAAATANGTAPLAAGFGLLDLEESKPTPAAAAQTTAASMPSRPMDDPFGGLFGGVSGAAPAAAHLSRSDSGSSSLPSAAHDADSRSDQASLFGDLHIPVQAPQDEAPVNSLPKSASNDPFAGLLSGTGATKSRDERNRPLGSMPTAVPTGAAFHPGNEGPQPQQQAQQTYPRSQAYSSGSSASAQQQQSQAQTMGNASHRADQSAPTATPTAAPTATATNATKASTSSAGSASFRAADFAMGSKPTATKARGGDAFQDLLGERFQKDDKKNQTLAAMSHTARAKTEDPVKLAVEEWVSGKEKNVRALLASMQAILWENAAWKPVSMATLMDYGQVRKSYQRACLVVHPDKVRGEPHEQLAQEIFIQLAQAYELFTENG